MTPTRLAELRQMCEEATEGPWTVSSHLTVDGLVPLQYRIFSGPKFNNNAPSYEPTGRQADSDAAFVCAARAALPEALAEIKRLRAALEAARAEHCCTGYGAVDGYDGACDVDARNAAIDAALRGGGRDG